jgi:LEA14-like dessication related protein
MIILTSVGCASTKEARQAPATATVQPGGVVVEYDRLEFENQTVGGATFIYRFTATNSGPETVSYSRCDYSFSFNGRPPIRASADVSVTVPPGGQKQFQIPMAVTYAASAAELKEILTRRTAMYALSATLTGSGPATEFSAEYMIGLPQLPTVTIPGASISSGEHGELGLSFDIFVTNPNVFTVKTEAVTYTLSVEGVQVGSGKVAELERIQPNSQIVYTFPARMDLKANSAKMQQVYERKALDWSMTGIFKLEGYEFPLQESGTINFSR